MKLFGYEIKRTAKQNLNSLEVRAEKELERRRMAFSESLRDKLNAQTSVMMASWGLSHPESVS